MKSAPRQVRRTRPALDRWSQRLSQVDYADAWATPVLRLDPLDPIEWAHAALGPDSVPAGVRALLRLRDRLVRLVGLETITDKQVPYTGFPLLDQSPQAVLLGMDDRHLDFRVVVQVTNLTVTLTTVVVLHNWFGRLYWTVVQLFHPLIAKQGLRRARPRDLRR